MAREIPGYEWASLTLDGEFFPDEELPLNLKCKSVTVARDSKQQLLLTARGEGLGPQYRNTVAGRPSRKLQLRLRSRQLEHVIADGFVPASTKGHNDYLAQRHETVVFGRLNKLSRRISDGTPHFFVEWLQNAPDNPIWTRSTYRSHSGRQERVRGSERAVRETGSPRPSGSSDHLALKLNLPTLSRICFGIVHPSHVSNSPEVERPGFLQFEAGPNGIANQRLRYSVRCALNFLFGCGLGVLGWSEFDRDF